MNHQSMPAKVRLTDGVGPLPPTRYALGVPSDGYSADRLLDGSAWGEDGVRAYAATAVAAERERWVLHCTAMGDLAATGGNSIAEVADVLDRLRVMGYMGPNVAVGVEPVTPATEE